MEWPLTGAAMVFFVAYALEITADLRGASGEIANAVIWVTWAVFLVDYIVRLVVAQHRWRWFYRHLLDLAIVVLPMLRPLRLMRFLTIIAILQRGAGSLLRGRLLIYTAGATLVIVVIAALAVLDAERGTGNITTFGDALWWAFTTITTVGYGDFYPVTVTGRLVAAGLMVGGLTLIGIVTATIASWIIERVTGRVEKETASTDTQLADLRSEVQQLKEMIRAMQPTGQG